MQTKSLVKFMAHIYALLLSGSDIRFLGTTGPEPEPKPDIRYILITISLCKLLHISHWR